MAFPENDSKTIEHIILPVQLFFNFKLVKTSTVVFKPCFDFRLTWKLELSLVLTILMYALMRNKNHSLFISDPDQDNFYYIIFLNKIRL